jgi:hypothetical protein
LLKYSAKTLPTHCCLLALPEQLEIDAVASIFISAEEETLSDGGWLNEVDEDLKDAFYLWQQFE